MIKTGIILTLAALFIVGCASVRQSDGTTVRSLGIAEYSECQYYETPGAILTPLILQEPVLVKECTEVKTDAFSAWETLVEGIGDTIIKVMRLGF